MMVIRSYRETAALSNGHDAMKLDSLHVTHCTCSTLFTCDSTVQTLHSGVKPKVKVKQNQSERKKREKHFVNVTHQFLFQVQASWAFNASVYWLSVNAKVPQSQFESKQGAVISNVSGFTFS